MQSIQVRECTTERRVSPEEFASMIGVSVYTVYRMCRRKDLVAAKVAGQWRINASESLAKLGI